MDILKAPAASKGVFFQSVVIFTTKTFEVNAEM
jgi:hypothetical protein